MIEKIEKFVYSTNKRNKLHVVIWRPMDKVRAILQISHGMCEYIERYDRLASYLADRGILVVGNDHLGHGHTAEDLQELGYFATTQLSKTVVDDLYKVSKLIKAQYPQVPFFILGHSMGSFMVRRYLMTYGHMPDGAIIMGTGSQPDLLIKSLKGLTSVIGLIKGQKFRHILLNKIVFGAYQKKIKQPRTEFDWLTRDMDIVDLYIADPYCHFLFTVNGYKTLADVIAFIQNKKNIDKIPKDLPLLFLAGDADPVGHYGKDVDNLVTLYQKMGIKSVQKKLYPGARHEILNEWDYEIVHEDILQFIEHCMY